MIFLFGPLYNGKRAAAAAILHCEMDELSRRAIWDVQELAARTVNLNMSAGDPDITASRAADKLDALAEKLSRYEVVIATEIGGGVVPMDAGERAAREAAGRLNCLLAERATAVIRVFCGIPLLIKGELP